MNASAKGPRSPRPQEVPRIAFYRDRATTARPASRRHQRTVAPRSGMTGMERFYFEQSMKAVRQAHARFDNVLSKVFLVCSVLIGGGLVLLDKLVLAPEWKVGMLSLFFLGVVFCLLGLFPTGGPIPRNPYAIRAQQERAIRRKQDTLVVACFALALGFAVGILGVYVQASVTV